MPTQGAWIVDILVEWGTGPAHVQSNRQMQFVMASVNILIILGFSMVRDRYGGAARRDAARNRLCASVSATDPRQTELTAPSAAGAVH